MLRNRIFLAAASLYVLSTAAFAQSSATVAAPHVATSHRHAKTHAATHAHASIAAPRSTEDVEHDLIHGSPAQRQLEQSDNDRANLHDIDHSKDEFGSDYKGF